MDRLDALRLFIRVVDSGSFAAAARDAGVGQPAVSKQMAGLERYFGAQLMRRTSRSMTLTEAGQALYESGRRLLDDFGDIEARIGHGQVAVSGLIRLTVAPAFGRLYVVPLLPAFFARHPDVAVDLTATERTLNLVEEGYDLALKHGVLGDSTLVARHLGSSAIVVVATPAYLAQRGVPRHPRELAGHRCVLFAPLHEVRPWQFRVDGQPFVFQPQGPFRSGDGEQIRAAVLADMGLAQGPAWLFAAELAAGTVTPLLGGFAPAPLAINALHPAGRRLPGRVRALIDFLAQALSDEPLLAPARDAQAD